MLHHSASLQSLYLILMGENPTLKTKRKKSNCTKKVQWVFQFHHYCRKYDLPGPCAKIKLCKIIQGECNSQSHSGRSQNQSEPLMPHFGKGCVQLPLEFSLSSPGGWLWAFTEVEGKQLASGESLEHRQPLPYYQKEERVFIGLITSRLKGLIINTRKWYKNSL